MDGLIKVLTPEGFQLLLTLFLSFLVGIEREEQKRVHTQYSFGGVRTFPLVGIIGYLIAMLSGSQMLPVTIGFAVIAGFMFLSFKHKLSLPPPKGLTTEMSALTVFLVGVLVARGMYWISCTVVVMGLLLLELKTGLEQLAKRIPSEEITTFTKFLLISLVILPVIPNEEFTQFKINPFKTWLIVVAVNAVSYGSYVLQKVIGAGGGVMLSAVLGGAYSSTVTTVSLAKASSHTANPRLFSGAILVASGVMYLRLAVLILIFNWELFKRLGLSFFTLSLLAIAFGYLWSRRSNAKGSAVKEVPRGKTSQNPLELGAALFFAFVFVAILIVTQLTIRYLGQTGMYVLAGVMGVSDVDPFILGLTQSVAYGTSLTAAAVCIVIATSSNGIAKGIYAYVFGDKSTGRQSLSLLLVLAVLGCVPLLWL